MRKVLIICYYWPPAGGPGVQRWLKFVKYFREFGIEPVVFVPENAHYPLQDEGFVSEIPQGIEVIQFPIKEPYRFAKWFSRKKTKQISSGIISEKNPSFLEKLMLFVRGNLFIPDARIGWVKPSVAYLTNYLSNNEIDTVITTGPPHSLHLIGLQLRRKLNLKWIADFRDPWTTIHYHKSLRLTKISEKKHKRLEKTVLNTADQVVVTSPTTKEEFKKITKRPIEVITNGYDEVKGLRTQLDANFSLVHVGSLLSNRNPEVLWKIIAEISSEKSDFKESLQIRLVGAVGEEIKESLAKYHLIGKTTVPGYVSHTEALQLQHNAQLLLLIEMDKLETKAIIPGKLFEYLQARRPILCLGPEGSDMEAIIDETSAGRFCRYSEEKAIKEYILKCYKQYKDGMSSVDEKPSANVQKYSRKELTRAMSKLIKDEVERTA